MTTTLRPDQVTDDTTPGADAAPPADAPDTPDAASGAGGETAAGEEAELEQPAFRLGVSVGFPVVGAAIMTGGIFLGVTPRIYAAIAGLLGVALGVLASKIKRPVVANLAIVGGIFAIGLWLLTRMAEIDLPERFTARAGGPTHVGAEP